MKRSIAAIAVALAAAACGGSRGAGDRPPEHGNLSVTQRINGHLYVEGSIGYVEVSDGHSIVYKSKIGNGASTRLPAGTYRLNSYQELCIGNCDHLGPPIDKCGTTIHIESEKTTSAIIELTPTQNRCVVTTT